MKTVDLQYFPGWTRKAITFTMDDGNVTYDRIFIDMVRPYGIKGAFNLSSNNIMKHNDPEGMRALYRGFEVTNHVKYHPYAFFDGAEPAPEQLAGRVLPSEDEADIELIYDAPERVKGLYMRYSKDRNRWEKVATAEAYIALTDACKKEMEDLFGEGTIGGFVWPYHRQKNTEVIEYLKTQYYGIRNAGGRASYEDLTFSLPENRENWIYNARHSDLLEMAEKFESLPDEGQLKWFAFGVHPIDFERAGNWDDLKQFCRRYGNRPEDYWYATNIEILQYEDAVKSVIIKEDRITNPSDVDLYIKIDNTRITLPAGCTIFIND